VTAFLFLVTWQDLLNPEALFHKNTYIFNRPLHRAASKGRVTIETPGGRYFAEFDGEAPVTREGQLLFFAQFLHAGGRWERFVSNTPLDYVGNRGSAEVDVLGTVTPSTLCGHWHRAHMVIGSIRRCWT